MRNPLAGGSDGRTWAALPVAFLVVIGSLAVWLSLISVAAPVSITVPLSATAVLDTDLDGDPATGAWEDALVVNLPLENGEPAPYGTASFHTKHDGSNLYVRVDGFIDVPWLDPSSDYFWVGMQISQTRTAHHVGDEWDGAFFGLWNGLQYTPQPTYPPASVDTHGFDRPPTADVLQDVLGSLRYAGSVPPYNFTAEWRRPLDSGDGDDLSLRADGLTTYNFFVTTDSNGGGSAGGSISHRQVTNLNSMKLEASQSALTPPSIVHVPPGDVAADQAVSLSARVTDDDGVAEVQLNYTDIGGEVHNETMVLVGSTYVFTVPPQNASGTIIYHIWAVDSFGSEARTVSYEITVSVLLATPFFPAVVPADGGCLRISWAESVDEVTGYRLYRWNSTSRSMEQIAELLDAETSHTDCDVEPDRVYSYWIISFDVADNESPPSALVTGRTPAPTEPAPADLTILVALAIVGGLTALAVFAALLLVKVMGRLRPPKGGRESS